MDLDEPVEDSDDIESLDFADSDECASPVDTGESLHTYRPRRNSTKTNRSRALYIRKSITRLSVISDRPLNTKSDICAALEDYGHCLPPEQRAALEKWCDIK